MLAGEFIPCKNGLVCRAGKYMIQMLLRDIKCYFYGQLLVQAFLHLCPV